VVNRPLPSPDKKIARTRLPLNESEAGVELVLIETSLFYLLKLVLISMRTVSLAQEKQGDFYENEVSSSLTLIQRPGN